MKNPISFLLLSLLFIPATLISQTSDAPKTLHCLLHDQRELSDALQKNEPIAHIVFEGKGSRSEWRRALRLANSFTNLRSVTFQDNELEVLPTSVASLVHVRKISIVENDLADLEACIETLADITQLKCLEIEVFSLDELPENLSSLAQLDTLIARSPEYTDFLNSALAADRIAVKYESFEVPGTLGKKPIGTRIYCLEEELENENPPPTIEGITSVKPCLKKSYASFQPPVAELDIPVAVYSIDPTQTQKLIYAPSGTELIIPNNAFIDANGNPITDQVDIDYREFRDPVDFFASGIPMSFNEPDSSLSFFTSAGMFDMYASVDGEEVFIQPGKNIDINFASTDSISTFNFYQYNDAVGKWDEAGDAPLTQGNTSTTALSWAWAQYESMMNKKVMLGDTTLFSDRFESDQYYHTRKKILGMKKAPLYSTTRKLRFRMNNLVKIRSIRKTSEGDIVFKIKTRKLLHPEMQAFNNQDWQLTSGADISDFRKNYGYRHKFNDIRVNKAGDTYSILLKDDSSHTEIDATTVVRTEENHHLVYKPYKANYKAYKNTLKNRQRSLDKKIIRQKKLYYKKEVAGLNRKQKSSWRKSKRYMSPDERKLSFAEWQTYYNTIKASSLENVARYDRRAGFRRAVRIGSMGLYNCDLIIQPPPPPLNLYVNFIDADKNPIEPQRAYVMDSNLNSTIALTEKAGNDRLYLSYLPRDSQQVVVLTQDNQFAVCNTRNLIKQINATPEGGTISLTIDNPSVSTRRLNEIRALLQL
ncbi:MAG: hypothetical protein ACKVOK_03680 [Flavobacteriales bacterium]